MTIWKVTRDLRGRLYLEFHLDNQFESSICLKKGWTPELFYSLEDQISIEEEQEK